MGVKGLQTLTPIKTLAERGFPENSQEEDYATGSVRQPASPRAENL